MEELGIPDLTTEQTETLCLTAEKAAKQYILSKVPLKMVNTLNISIEAEGTKPVNLTVEVDLVLSAKIKNLNTNTLVSKAIQNALDASEIFLRNLK